MNFGAANPAIFYTVNSPTSLTVTAPAGPIGTVDVTVTTPGGTSATGAADRFTYVAPPQPVVTGVSPTSGPNGTFVTITGTNFAGATVVNFGAGNPATFTVNDPTTIYATAPSGSGAVDVTVTTPGGTSATGPNDHYTYTLPNAPTVTAVGPASGFQRHLGRRDRHQLHRRVRRQLRRGQPGPTFTVNSDTSITATAPAGSGTVDVTVTTSGGTSATGVRPTGSPT